jgi:hypothetical protein
MDAPAHQDRGDLPGTWELIRTRACFSCGELQGAVDVTAPARGLTDLLFHGAPIDGWLLGVEVNTAPSEAYVRGRDLVVVYRETEARPFSVQVYWSVTDRQAASAYILDATVSIQTRQWEAYPQVSLQSSIAGAPLDCEGEGLRLLRPAGLPWTYAETAPPEDFSASGASGSPEGATQWTFGEQFMERGVIRRLRVRGAIVPRKVDARAAREIRSSFLAEQPPLTA